MAAVGSIQRNRGIEHALAQLRNIVAHPTGYQLFGPLEAARILHDLAETINQLWGMPTPGGRLYPAPARREVIVMAWPADGSETITVTADALADATDPEDQPWQCIFVRAVFRPDEHYAEPSLRYFDSRVEATTYPSDLLCGPGTITDAKAWCAQHQPSPDQIDHLDRTFLIRHHANHPYLPIRPQTAAALPQQDRPTPGTPSRPTTLTMPTITSAPSSPPPTATLTERAVTAAPRPSRSARTTLSPPESLHPRRSHPTQRRRGHNRDRSSYRRSAPLAVSTGSVKLRGRSLPGACAQGSRAVSRGVASLSYSDSAWVASWRAGSGWGARPLLRLRWLPEPAPVSRHKIRFS
ncbi:hypothetical protein [Catenuloplanes atrovinosus]|uniref:Uncharacterized protein n=1 Tax=Catenuloplanes atrovinosus TaxID=137266 RepID=A0AAE3YP35_9ACTN|nr:hypothetical protein [Catenuloplanes atrovinosus]MDR7275679.1 hypothetical protein [Catenuloplanes atrovinosus]